MRAARERIRERLLLYTRCQMRTTGGRNGPPDRLQYPAFPPTARVQSCGRRVHVGDRSPKSKERDQKQKNAAKAESAAQARSKQDHQSRATQVPGKAKK